MDPIDQLTREAAGRIGETLSPARIDRQRARADRMYRTLHTRPDLRRWWAVPAALAVMLALVWLVQVAPRDAALVATLAARPVAAGSSLRAGQEPLALEFSDRSRVALAPETDARLAQSDAGRVRIELERGRIELSVTPGGQRAWIVGAGPYTVDVTGTVFAVAWEPGTQNLTVDVTTGSVRVRGVSLGEGGTRLSAGQHLRLGGAQVPSPAGPPATLTEATPDCREPACGVQARAVGRPLPSVTWRELAERGDHVEALAAIEREGVTALVERLGAADLDRLILSARLAGAAVPAHEGLLALRRRFPAHAAAHGAAFLLGRVAFDLAGDTRTAASWFETYLREQPGGALAEQARGRLMELWSDGGDGARAQGMARDYLQHHGGGERAELARRILESP